MGEKITKIPRGAMRFVDSHCDSSVFSVDEQKENKLNMTIYSGGIIKNHWYWKDLAIDLDGLFMDSDKLPILENHDTSRKIAFSTDVLIDKEGGVRVNPDKTVFLDTKESLEFQENSKKGFPYQSSISVTPEKIEKLEEGAFAEVNGYKMAGPGHIFRESTMNEGSVCVFGWDSKTQSTAFSKEEVDVDIDLIGLEAENADNNEELSVKNKINQEEVEKMSLTLELLEKDNPELLASIKENVRKEVTAEMEAKFTEEKKGLELQISEIDKKNLRLEKRELLRTEDENKLKAKVILTSELSKSDVPEHLYDKVHNMFRVSDYAVKNDDGFDVLDEEKFKKAVIDEIPSWESSPDTSNIGGVGFTKKSSEKENSEEMTNDLSDALLEMIGQKVEK